MTLRKLHNRLKGRPICRRWFGGVSMAAALFCAAGLAVASLDRPPPNQSLSEPGVKPKRIVSMNLCTDQLVMLLAEHERIASLSYLALDPQASALAEEAANLPVNHGLSEEILPLEPDLILAGTFTTRPTVFLLRKLNFPVIELPVVVSLEDIRKNIRTVADALGETERGENLIAAMDHRLPSPPETSDEHRPLAALYWANGYTSGKGTLAHNAVVAAGFRNLGSELGLTGTSQLPLETLLAADPGVLITGRVRQGAALANEFFRHPALKLAFANRPRVSMPDHLWVCGTPFVAEAVERLSQARDAAQAGPRIREKARDTVE